MRFGKKGDKLALETENTVKLWPPKSRAQQAFDMNVAVYLIDANLPFSHVETQAWHRLVKCGWPQANLKGRDAFRLNKTNLAEETVQAMDDLELMSELRHCKMIAFTSDFWKARSLDLYINLSLHYVTRKFEMKHFCVGFAGWLEKETQIEIGKGLTKMIDSVKGLSDTGHPSVTMVTDSDRKMIAGVRKANVAIQHHIPCTDHQMQLALKHATTFKPTPADDATPYEPTTKRVEEALTAARVIAARLNQSCQSEKLVRDEAHKMKRNINFLKYSGSRLM
jgi:hypothetical protein